MSESSLHSDGEGEAVGDPGGSVEDQSEGVGPSPTAVVDESADSSVAAAQLLPVESATGDDVSIYQLKWVEWAGEFSPVIVQNVNGPCPLLALCNVLILTAKIKLTPGQTDVSSTHLTDLLGTFLFESHKTNQLSDGEKANLEQNIQDTMAIFPKLQTGLDVNVKFNSVSGFEFTRETGIFDLLGVPLYHGWLVDPQNAWYEVVRDLSYNQLAEKVINDASSQDSKLLQEALLGQQFLESTATQLTYHGICELSTNVKEGDLCVFFRNNHFNTLMKKNGNLLTLVTDHGFLNEMGYIWQTLTDTDGGGEFLDAHLHLSPHSQSQQNRAEAVPSGGSSPSHGTTPPLDRPESEGRRTSQEIDYQAALSLQEEEYHTQQPDRPSAISSTAPLTSHSGVSPGTREQELLDQELAAQLQQEARFPPSPPNTPEAYERASREYQRQDQESRGNGCVML